MSDNARYTANLINGLVIPASQALVTGALSGSIVGSVAGMIHAEQPATIGLLSGALVGAGYWFKALSWWRSTIREPELVPAQVYPADVVRLEVTQDDTPYGWGLFLDVSIDPEIMRFALGELAAGVDLSMSALVGRGKMSRAEFCALRDALIRAGLAYWLNDRAHSQGSRLGVGGRRVIERYANSLTLTSPSGLEMCATSHRTQV